MTRRPFRINMLGPVREHGPSDVTVNPRSIADEFLQEHGSCNGSTKAIPRMLQIGDIALELIAQLWKKGHLPNDSPAP